MKKRRKFIIFGLVIVSFFGCFNFEIPTVGDIVAPRVEAGPYEFYLTTYSVNFDTLLTYVGDSLGFDEYREVYPSGGGEDWFVLRDTFQTDFDMDMAMGLAPVQESVGYEIELVEVDDVSFEMESPVPLEDVIDFSPGGIDIPDGTPVPVDSIVIPACTTYAAFPMDEHHFTSGTMSVTITNNYDVDLGVPLEIAIHDSATGNPINDQFGDPLKLTWNTPIAPGATSSRSVDLTDVTFYKGIMTITTGVINSDGPDNIIVSDDVKNASFDASGSVSSLVVDYVTGDIDPFTYSDEMTADISEDVSYAGVTLDKVYLDPATIVIDIVNTSQTTSDLTLDFPKIDTISSTPAVEAFTTGSMTIPSGGSVSHTFNLSQSAIDLTSDFNFTYSIDGPGQYATVADGDSIKVNFSFYGENPGDSLFINSIDASFSNTTIDFEPMEIEGISFEMLPEEFTGIELSTVELSLDLSIDMDIPATLNMKLVGVKNSGNDSLEFPVSQQITGPGSDPHIVINDAEDLINFKPEQIMFSGDITLDGSGGLSLDQLVDIQGAVAVPFQFDIISPIVFTPDYSKMKLDELPEFIDDFTGILTADVNNGFQFGVEFDILAARDTNHFSNPDSFRTVAQLDLEALTQAQQTLTLTKDLYDFFAASPDSVWLSMEIALTGRNDGQPTTFLSTDSVSMSLSIQAEGSLDFSTLTDTTGGAE